MESNGFVVWRVLDKYGQCIDCGIDDFPIEFDLDQLPDGWSANRSIDKVQSTMRESSELWRKEKYVFEWKNYTFNNELKVNPSKEA